MILIRDNSECAAHLFLNLTTHMLSIEHADWLKLHDMFKARDAKRWQRWSPVSFPVRVRALNFTGGPLHSRALAHSRASLFTQPCPYCSHSRAPGEQWARLCVFTLQGCVQAARLCRGSPVNLLLINIFYDVVVRIESRYVIKAKHVLLLC